jgi:heme exporter protein D
MYFESLHDALNMNGHGAFVWGAYAITLGVLAGLVYVPLNRTRQFLREQRRHARREESRARGAISADK